MTITKPISAPSLPDVLNSLKRDVQVSMQCCKIGQILSFDATKKTAKVKIMGKAVFAGGEVPYPELDDVPVFTLQGGGGAVQLPIQAGDDCLVLFADRNIDIWYSTGTSAAPQTQRCHDLSDGIALVGINSLQSTLPSYPANELRITYGGARTALKGGKANVQNATYSLLQTLTDLINGIQGATVAGSPITDTTGKIAIALTELNGLLYKD